MTHKYVRATLSADNVLIKEVLEFSAAHDMECMQSLGCTIEHASGRLKIINKWNRTAVGNRISALQSGGDVFPIYIYHLED